MHHIQLELRKIANPKKIPIYKNFFKTGKGEYAEDDQFIGATVPQSRSIAKKFVKVSLNELHEVLYSPVHEDRLTALIIIVLKFQEANNVVEREKIVNFYLKNHLAGNNWDLIDCISDKILGPWLINKNKEILYKFAKSSNLWERRIAIITTFHFIKNNSFDDTLRISEILLYDKHDLIHKAVGWMLREIGKRDGKKLEHFLKKYYKVMPRIMLRYAIEKFDEEKRMRYLKGEV